MLINFGIESIFVKVLRRYNTNYSKQHIGPFEWHINTKKTKYIGRAILMNDILRIARLQRAFLGRAILRVIILFKNLMILVSLFAGVKIELSRGPTISQPINSGTRIRYALHRQEILEQYHIEHH